MDKIKEAKKCARRGLGPIEAYWYKENGAKEGEIIFNDTPEEPEKYTYIGTSKKIEEIKANPKTGEFDLIGKFTSKTYMFDINDVIEGEQGIYTIKTTNIKDENGIINNRFHPKVLRFNNKENYDCFKYYIEKCI